MKTSLASWPSSASRPLTSVRRIACAFLVAVAAGCGGEDGTSTTEPPPGALPCDALPIKTTRAPKLMWSCQRQNFLENLRATNHPQWQELIGLADRSDTSNQLYGDKGQFAALAYQVTGDLKYAKKGINAQIKELSANAKWNLNYTREEWAEAAITYDWLQGAATADERKQIEDVLYGFYDQFVKLDPKAPIRTNDSDQVTGNYFGIVLTALATPGNPRSAELLANPFVGGFDATGSDLTTLRNSLKKYIGEWSKGGVWVESSGYDIGTLQILMLGLEGLRTATGKDHFPELGDLFEQVARSQMEQMTPQFKSAPKWGDNEDVRDVMLWRRYACLGMAVGSLPDSSPLRPMATKFTNDMRAAAKATVDPIYGGRYYYFFNPTAETADYHMLPLSHYASAQGVVFAHDGWGDDDSLLFMHLRRPPMNVDHENSQFGDFQLWRKGGWVLTRPLGYGGGSIDPRAVNAVVIGGLDAMQERSVIGENAAADGSHVYFAGTTKGARYGAGYWDPPPAFVNEWTRSYLYLPTTMRTADTVIIYDRVDAVAPSKLDRFQGDDKTYMSAAKELKQWIIHTPVPPTVTGGAATWKASGQEAELTMLAPAQRNTATVDEKTLSWPASFPPETEKHFYLAISPKASKQYDTFLDVLQVSDATIASKPARVASGDGGMEGARVSRPGQGDAVALFSSAQGARVRTTEFSVTATIGTDGFDLYVADLDPSKSWSASPGGDLHVDASGFGHVRADGTGAVGITVKPN